MTDQEIRDIVADRVAENHGNKEFVRQIREGEQDDGPYIQGALALADYVNANYSMLPLCELVDDE